MTNLTLVIGNKNYSSWSLRPWLAMKQAKLDFEEVLIPLYVSGFHEKILHYSPAGKVPILIADGLTIWESLSICEYLAERFPEAQLWPTDLTARAIARCVSAEMHAGFANLRNHMGMNVRAQKPGQGRAPGVQEDIDRILALWTDCRQRFGQGGEFLFGQFSIADAMFAPVALRFLTYGVQVDANASAYIEALLALPTLQEWLEASRVEPYTIAQYEV
ncbi:glutathione S-transferase family protein [Leptolyngbya sp. FACHB-261]|uniref:glutathione S-transferase family protein n=1 Tax=Leptolyngbya sp. FACHB-261 TaxID=2692806 RepID=UPI0016890867|nr:glutathione S-transferase family protein [Leptolyngbya sp. FACHB-261]MBD2103347.1 glutathione S-transferase family protein [Leptolyngbya sp. FACHB-261]